MNPSLSIVVPAYNEAARLGKSLDTILAYLSSYPGASELIVVDDGSTDETARIAEQRLAQAGSGVRTKLIGVSPNRGKGYVVRAGLLASSAPVALFTDADLSTPITETPKLVEPIERGRADLTFGSRAIDRALIGIHQPWRREQGGKVFNLIVRLATRLPFWDTQCGFKAFRMSVCRPIIEAATIDRFGFDVELIYVAHLAKLSLAEIPVRWDHHEGSKIDVTRDSLRMTNEVRAIRRQARAGHYNQAIAVARETANLEKLSSAAAANQEQTAPSDASPELADAARRI
ncbi:MAG TPA: dolichyl-phosphate beta-glucosyltransferase [Pyrinomonadaceae bacterium]